MKLKRLVPSVIGSNTYLLFDNSGNAAVIDPGAPGNEILKAIKDEGASLSLILLTHGHFDHIIGLERLKAEYPDAQVLIHADDAQMMSDGHKNAFFDFFKKEREFPSADKLLIQGDVIEFGNEKITVLHTPGHTNGSVCYRIGKIIFTGDTVMANGYGRCDLYSGDTHKMSFTLNRLYAMSQKEAPITIYPGHGNSSSLLGAMQNIYK